MRGQRKIAITATISVVVRALLLRLINGRISIKELIEETGRASVTSYMNFGWKECIPYLHDVDNTSALELNLGL